MSFKSVGEISVQSVKNNCFKIQLQEHYKQDIKNLKKILDWWQNIDLEKNPINNLCFYYIPALSSIKSSTGALYGPKLRRPTY